MIDGASFLNQPVRKYCMHMFLSCHVRVSKWITYDGLRKIATGQRDDYTTGCPLQ